MAKSWSMRRLSQDPAAWRLATRVWPACPSSRWVSLFVLYPLMIGLMVVLLTFFGGGEQVSVVLVPWKLMLFWGMGVEFKRKIMSNYSREVEWQQNITTRIGFYEYNVSSLIYWMHYDSAVVNLEELQSSDPGRDCFQGVNTLLFRFQYWYSELSVKKTMLRHGKPHFIFVVWSALVVGGWVMRQKVLFRTGWNLICCVPG